MRQSLESASGSRRPALLFIVTESWYFRSHRLHLARAALSAGYEVHLASRFNGDVASLEADGIRCHALNWRRGGGLLGEIGALVSLSRIVRAVRPDVVHNVALKPVIVGSAAAWVGGRPHVVNAVTGLGYAFIGRGVRKTAMRGLLLLLMRLFVDRKKHVYIFQNNEDRERISAFGLTRNAGTVLIRGAGVDATRFAPAAPSHQPHEVHTIAVVSRMLAIKGIADVVEASRLLIARGTAHRLVLVGDPDDTNPSSISPESLEGWCRDPHVQWIGRVADVRPIWASSEIAALASIGGEGLPKSLLEAAACGRPIVATDVPGNREIVRHGENGLLVPPENPEALADALGKLIEAPALREQMGTAGRRLVLEEFTEERVREDTLALYSELVKRGVPEGRSRPD